MCMATSPNIFSSTKVPISKIISNPSELGALLNFSPKYSTSQTSAVCFAVLSTNLASATDYKMINKRHGWMEG